MPGHDAWVQYSLCTNVNALFSKVPMLEFRHQWVQGWDLALGNWSGYRVLVFMLVLGQSTTLYSVLSSHFRVACGRENGANMYTEHIGYPRCEHNIILCLYPGTSSRPSSADSHLYDLGVKLKHSRQKWWPCFYPREKKNGRINMSIIFISKKNKLKYHKLSGPSCSKGD